VVEDRLVESAHDWGLEAGDRATAALLDRGIPFTALFAHSDLIAVGAIRRLRQAGRRIPEDVSIVGFDDLPIAGYVDPPLTTVHQPMREVGALAASTILDRIAGGEPVVGPQLLPAELIVRLSTGPPG
jgi:DNA-binding LacI/PurR family transcriptional regulator